VLSVIYYIIYSSSDEHFYQKELTELMDSLVG